MNNLICTRVKYCIAVHCMQVKQGWYRNACDEENDPKIFFLCFFLYFSLLRHSSSKTEFFSNIIIRVPREYRHAMTIILIMGSRKKYCFKQMNANNGWSQKLIKYYSVNTISTNICRRTQTTKIFSTKVTGNDNDLRFREDLALKYWGFLEQILIRLQHILLSCRFTKGNWKAR